MPFYLFDWTPDIIEHLAEHDVTPAEFEEVVGDAREWTPSHSSSREVATGMASTGRFLCCVFDVHDNGMVIEPVTAYELER